MIGISLAYLPGSNFHEVSQSFFRLQEEFPIINACELHMECSQFSGAFHRAEDWVMKETREIRARAKIMGIHLPYLDLNPLAGNPRLADFAMDNYKAAIMTAASLDADYVVFHIRGRTEIPGPSQELWHWQEVTAELSKYAHANGLSFCLENADDMRLMADIETILTANSAVSLCVDIGHLFERVHSETGWQRLIGKIVDLYLPLSPLWGQGVPFYETDWDELLRRHFSRIRCIHLHNHNGKTAHCPLTQGKINLGRLLAPIRELGNIPLIIEADYRAVGVRQLHGDLEYLKELL